MYYTYLLRCDDNSVYTGITTDVQRRFRRHCSGKGAKYTRSHKPTAVLAVFESPDKSSAARLEYHIKCLDKKRKESVVRHKNLTVLQDKLDISQYHYIEGETLDGYS